MSDAPRLVQLGSIAGTPVNADVTALGSDVSVATVTLAADYQMLDPPGFPSRPGFTGAASLQFPRTVPRGSTFATFAAEATAIATVNGAVVIPQMDFGNVNNSQYLAMRIGG